MSIETAGSNLAPVRSSERLEILDVLRGFAIFGILLVNMPLYNAPLDLMVSGIKWWPGAADRAAEWFIHFFAQGKFYTLFSFLFGLGFALQMERAEAAGLPVAPVYRRRLLILLFIGLAHAFLIWWGDILVVYALVGFLLVLFRSVSEKKLLIWAGVFLFIPVLITGGLVALLELARLMPEVGREIDRGFAEEAKRYPILIKEAIRVYSSGSFSEIMGMRARDFAVTVGWSVLFFIPSVLGMFLLGLYAGKRRFFQNLTENLGLVRKIAKWGFGVGLAANLVYVVANEFSNYTVPSPTGLLALTALTFGAPALCFFYASTLILLFQDENWKKWLLPLAAVGRTAASNYLFQSVICTMVFYGYGLGFYGKVGPALGLVLTTVLFAMQIYLSRWWLKRFQFGPVEWFWRSLTYGKTQPFRLPSEAVQSGL